jgi:hypothetical protein
MPTRGSRRANREAVLFQGSDVVRCPPLRLAAAHLPDGLELSARVLTLGLTVPLLVEAKLLKVWELPGGGLPLRYFYYTGLWYNEFNALPASPSARGLRARITARAAVRGLVDGFVRGQSWAALVTPRGEGMEPVFERMRPPNERFVEMKTYETRTFGFFKTHGTFIAALLVPVDRLKIGRRSNDAAYKEIGQALRAGWISRLADDQIDGHSDVRTLV